MARVFVTRPLPGGALDRLRAEHDVVVRDEREPPGAAELARTLPGFDALLCMLADPVDGDVIAAATELRAIATYAVGTDNIELAAATARGIPVGNTPGVLTDATADLTLALMLGVMRRIHEAAEVVERGDWVTWEPAGLLGGDLAGAQVLIVGGGRIGSAVARRVEGFGATATIAGRDADVRALLADADVVTLHCPLTDATRGLIDADALTAMRSTSYLVNTARGPIVDTAALRTALEAGEIAGAALDVTDPEPLPADHPLLAAPNVLVAPHIGSATHATRGAMARMTVENLLAALAGERMPNCANSAVYT